MPPRKTPDDYRALATSRSLCWLGPEVQYASDKTTWRCAQGHAWEASYSYLKGCPFCAGTHHKTPENYHSLAISCGLHWLGSDVPLVSEPTLWRCAVGHEWHTAYSTVARGHGCPICAGNAQRPSSDYEALAALLGIEWLGPEVSNNVSKTRWRCPEGHEWESSFSGVRCGSKCPICGYQKRSQRVRSTMQDYHSTAVEHGYRWLGPQVDRSDAKTFWQCAHGHRWASTLSRIRAGKGCPDCCEFVNGARVSQPQVQLCSTLNGELNYPEGRYRIDIALFQHDCKIAIEYDSWYWHKNNLHRDQQRSNYLIDCDWRILRIKANCKLPSNDQLQTSIERLTAGSVYEEIVLDHWGGIS